jgi:medium-chain acyl-[acyl-carrier-protein] hydrolase
MSKVKSIPREDEFSHSTTDIDSWFPYIKQNPLARLRLFCFPHAGGGASAFRKWQDELPSEIEVCAIQLPGRENRFPEPPFTELTSLLHLLERVFAPYLNKPFAFFGHSLGALISFEFARQLRRQHGLQPVHLFVSGARAPQIPRRLPTIHHLPDTEFTAGLRRLNCTPDEVFQNTELLELLLPVLRADFALLENYAYVDEVPFDCPVSVFNGLQDELIKQDDSAAWHAQTKNICNFRMFAGDHFFLQNARSLVLQAISQDLVHVLC